MEEGLIKLLSARLCQGSIAGAISTLTKLLLKVLSALLPYQFSHFISEFYRKIIMNLNSLLTFFRNGCNILNSELKFIFERGVIFAKVEGRY